MKLVMFTPASHTSAIGRVAVSVIRALRLNGHDVRVVVTDFDDPRDTHLYDCQTLSWRDDPSVVEAALQADICVYQVGDNFPFHAGAVRWMSDLPGVVCLHDYFVGHLFDAWCHANGLDGDTVVRAWYGAAVARRLASADPMDLAERARLAPMTEWICAQAIGVLTHSRWVVETVTRACPGPVRSVPLPYELRRVPVEPSASRPGMFRLLTVGHMNSNKRVASVIRAVGSDEKLRQRVVYTLVGTISPVNAQHIQALAEAEGVEVVLVNDATDADVAGALAEAHCVVALRWPCLEAASASAIEGMLAGKPTLVTRFGFYDEIPDECVLKIDHAREVDDVRTALRLLIDDPDTRLRIGTTAREHALRHHRPEPYAAELVELAREALLVAAPLEVVRRTTAMLYAWGGNGDVGDEFVFGPLRDLWSRTGGAADVERS
jgi:glycosyltransferase involved in cell wall biosynthesis